MFGGLAVYLLITVLGYFMSTATHFFALAVLVGMVQGGTQALSRSLFASMIPRHKSSEFFAFFSVFERYAGVLGPAIFAFVVERSGSGRSAILAVAVFFVLGAAMLTLVDVDRGRPRGAHGRGGAASSALRGREGGTCQLPTSPPSREALRRSLARPRRWRPLELAAVVDETSERLTAETPAPADVRMPN